MEKGLVTVVVPIYNTEKYLDRCITSIVNQTYQNLEILLIDDGSPDNCPQMCDIWAERDLRIRVIHKENAGLGMARNTGIEHATGEYICFFDSDDYIAFDTIEKTYKKAITEQAEVVVFGFADVDAAGNIVKTFAPSKEEKTFRGKVVREEFLPELIAPDPKGNGQRRFYMSACMMLFSANVIRTADWRFVSEREIISEDIYSLLKLFQHISSVAVVSEVLYFYCTNEVSLSRKYIPGRYEKVLHFYMESVALCERLHYGHNVIHRVSKQYLGFTIAAMKQEMASNRSFGEKKRSVHDIVCDPMLQQVLEKNREDNVSWKQKVLFWMMQKKRVLSCCGILLAQNAFRRR